MKKLIERHRFLGLFVIMVTFFLLKAISPHEIISIITSISFFILLVYSLYIIGGDKSVLWALLLIGGIGDITVSLVHSQVVDPAPILLTAQILCAILFYCVMFYVCFFFTLHDKNVTHTTLYGALCAYLFIGLVFSSLYLLIYQYNPLAFSGLTLKGLEIDDDLIYFSFVTLTTLGYGDIVPMTKFAKTLTWIEACFGQAFLTLLIAQIVGRYIQFNPHKPHKH